MICTLTLAKSLNETLDCIAVSFPSVSFLFLDDCDTDRGNKNLLSPIWFAMIAS
eukprot:TRINITY_DN539_c0_g1_i1.p2 TRINITY_DN539_c0_g1~~TRINITY_DN539_c0_g1_i1.p2  ORF type:complete len:54 (-),score=1.53 TRINITY_DN539_c0_g1_i1:42-203(-)